MIEIEHLKKSYGKLTVLKGISALLEQGKVIAVVGPNASGKTTLIKSILGMVMPEEGSIQFDGEEISGHYEYKSKIGYMPQIGRYPDNIQVGQLFGMMKDIRNGSVRKYDEELISSFGLESVWNKPMRVLSGGTRQKVSAALAFLFDPPVLILDEPTAGLDPLSSEILKEKISKARSTGKLIIITSHIMTEVDELADSILFLVEGTVRFFLSVEEIKARTGNDRLGKAMVQLMNGYLHD